MVFMVGAVAIADYRPVRRKTREWLRMNSDLPPREPALHIQHPAERIKGHKKVSIRAPDDIGGV